MRKVCLFALVYCFATFAVQAQQWDVTVPPTPSPAGNLYAQNTINMMPGFQATTPGFEAKIKLPEATAGRWSSPLLWTPYPRGGAGTPITGMVGIHTHVLPSGKVLSWEGHPDQATGGSGTAMAQTHAYEWNPDPNARMSTLTYPNVYVHYDISYSNIFCSGHSFLANGNLFVAGGHYSGGVVDRGNSVPPSNILGVNRPGNADYIPPSSPYPNFSSPNVNGAIGLRDGNIFHFAGNAPGGRSPWQAGIAPMRYRRWYPTNTTLNNGEVLVVAGQMYGGPIGLVFYPGVQANNPEVYNPLTNSWRELTNATRQLPLYPWMFGTPDGRVFNAGPNVRTGFLNPTAAAIGPTAAGTWTDGPPHLLRPTNLPTAYDYSERIAGTAVMYQPGKILIAGGRNSAAGTITKSTELINLNDAAPAWQAGAGMNFARHHVNSTVLADGTVLVTGGNQRDSENDADAVLPAELWTPPASGSGPGTWAVMNAMDKPRLYHSTAVLLPDATVLSAGGGQGGDFKIHADYEIFTPPYLCQPGTSRPVIGYGPRAIAYGQPFAIFTPDATTITRATWVRLSSVTHSFNMNQRFMDLPVTYDSYKPGQLTITGPPDANASPPGHYMLFLISGAGVPSVAQIVSVGNDACPAELSLTTFASYSDCEQTTNFTISNPVNCQADYRWLVNGTYLPAYDGQPSLNWTTTSTSPTVQVQVEATRSCAGTPAPPGSSVIAYLGFTSYFPNCGAGCSGCGDPRPASAVQPTAGK